MLLVLSAVLLSLVAWRLAMLTLPGAIAGLVISISSILLGGVWWYVFGVIVFASGGVLTWIQHLQSPSSHTKSAKHPRRLVQVAAYGGPSMLLMLLSVVGAIDPERAFVAYLAVLATATADNTATEVGKLSHRDPRLITNATRVPIGTSGGVTFIGLLASLVGATFIPMFLFALPQTSLFPDESIYSYLLVLSLIGFCGSLLDSFLGATIQAKFACSKCRTIIETRWHVGACNGYGDLVSGIAVVSNEMVNALTGTISAVAALLVWR